MWRGPILHVLCMVLTLVVNIWRGEGSAVVISFVNIVYPMSVNVWRACPVDNWRGHFLHYPFVFQCHTVNMWRGPVSHVLCMVSY